MNILRLSTLSLTLAIAGITLGLAAAPAMADPPGDHGHNHGGGSDGEDATIYTVTLDFLSVPAGLLTEPVAVAGEEECRGTTDIQANPGLTVQMVFNEDCSVWMTVDTVPLKLYPFRLDVKTKKAVTTVRLGFTTSTLLFPTPGDTIYMTNFLFASIKPDIYNMGQFVLTPMTDETNGETLTKIHQPGKGDTTEKGVLIGSFTYTPIP